MGHISYTESSKEKMKDILKLKTDSEIAIK
jgi:hypothetical protein